MPPWVQDGGLEAWIARLKDPAVRTRALAEMRDPAPAWENLYGAAGAAGTLLLGFKNPALKPLTGRTLADVAQRSEEHTSELQSQSNLVCRLLLEKKKNANLLVGPVPRPAHPPA